MGLNLSRCCREGCSSHCCDIVCRREYTRSKKAADLSGEQVGALREALVAVPRIAVDVDADSSRFPEDWIFHHRWSEKTAPKKFSFVKIGGRVRTQPRAACSASFSSANPSHQHGMALPRRKGSTAAITKLRPVSSSSPLSGSTPRRTAALST